MGFLELRDVWKRFGGETVLAEVDMSVEEGEFVVLVGPSGCGKSTLLRIVAGLEAATAGDVLLDGRRVNDLSPRARDVAMVFQNYALYPHMSVRRNLAFPLQMSRLGRSQVAARVEATAKALGLEALLERKPASLSGGQMQRVALGRAIVRDPRLFLFDEPLSNLDAKLREDMRAEIVALHARLGITSLYVTHDQAEAMTMGTRICVLEGGRVQQSGPPLEVFERPATTFVASFIGSPPMNLVPGTARDGIFRAADLALPAPLDAHTLGIRPHQVRLGGDLSLAVERVEHLGSRTLLHGVLADTPFVVSQERHIDVAPPTTLAIECPAESLHWFDADGVRL